MISETRTQLQRNYRKITNVFPLAQWKVFFYLNYSFEGFIFHYIFYIQDMYVTVNRLLSLAGRLLDSRHFASSSIRQVALMLEKGWKEFASLLDLRTQVLGLSVTFHQKAEQVVAKKIGIHFVRIFYHCLFVCLAVRE